VKLALLPGELAGGEWTDDTSMALALADSIAEAGWDINDQAERYVRWWQTGAYWGESGIPADWLEGPAGEDMIEKALRGLLREET
jgi:ADP-ribosylglycohydrolase